MEETKRKKIEDRLRQMIEDKKQQKMEDKPVRTKHIAARVIRRRKGVPEMRFA